MKKLKAAIIGSGLIAKLKHIPAFHKYRDKVHLAALCDVNIEAARQAASTSGIPTAYADVAEMLAKEKPDIVDICTPPKTHAKLAIQVMQAGSHVLIEKPMAQSVEECDAIITAAAHTSIHERLFTGFLLRLFQPVSAHTTSAGDTISLVGRHMTGYGPSQTIVNLSTDRARNYPAC